MNSEASISIVQRAIRSARYRSGRAADAVRQKFTLVSESVRSGLSDAALRLRARQIAAFPPQPWHPLFHHPLVDLGAIESELFAGVLSPVPEVGRAREGVDSTFLDQAEDYYAKYQGFDYWRTLIKDAAARLNLTSPAVIVEFGCGFGNSTLPMLDLFPGAIVVATDISPNLLVILRRLLVARKLEHRCLPVAMDAQKDFIAPASADLVIGSAILHHLVDPTLFIRRAFEILRPGGAAVFFEPFEGGQALMRLICQEVVAEAQRRGEESPALDAARRWGALLEPQIFRQAVPGWKDMNDKWAFPRSVLDHLASAVDAELIVYPVHDSVAQFRRAFTYLLETCTPCKRSDLPDWAWAIFDRYDTQIFSPEMLTDLALEGCVIFRKRDRRPATRSVWRLWQERRP